MGLLPVVTTGRAIVLAVISAAWLSGSTRAGDEPAPRPAQSTVRGRVIDESGRVIPGARVRLYRRDSRWERHHPVVAEAKAGPDGGFSLVTPLKTIVRSRSRAAWLPTCSWPIIPARRSAGRTSPSMCPSFEATIALSSPVERTITVVDADRRPLEGAKVVAYGVGDPSSPRPEFREPLELRPDDGPLTAITGADGRATFLQLPRTKASFVATKAGFGEAYAFDEITVIRLTPAANLSGRVTGPGGEPLARVRVVLHTGFMWDFERTVTDAEGRYRFKDLRAKGWDMSAWTPNKEADGTYKMWLEDDRVVMRTENLTLEPNTDYTLDIKAMKAGIIRVKLVEEGTNKPVAGARIWGFDKETGSSARFNAYTDDQGRATFHSAPSQVSLSLAGPPEGVYLDGDLGNSPEANRTFEFAGGEEDLTLVMPKIAGTLLTIPGICTASGRRARRQRHGACRGGPVSILGQHESRP